MENYVADTLASPYIQEQYTGSIFWVRHLATTNNQAIFTHLTIPISNK